MTITLADAVDSLLELSIAGSFTRVGFEARRRMFDWDTPAPDSLRGRSVLVTGPTSGLGWATASAMADLGARVLLVGRSRERLSGVRDRLVERHGEDRFPVYLADMSSLSAVRVAVELIGREEPRLDVLVDSAGAIAPARQLTPDGLETTFATMVAGPFTLISGLLPLLSASGDGQVVTVVSGGMYFQSLPLDDLQFERGDFDGTRAYARAKRAATALTREWARRYGGPVRFDAMHPGWADTPGLAEQLPSFYALMKPVLRTPAEGADTIAWLASDRDPARPDGRLWLDRRPRPFDRFPATPLSARDRAWLWDEVVRLTGGFDPTV